MLKRQISIIIFYLRIILVFPVSSFLVVLSGFAQRVLSIGSFVLVFKTLLSILSPNSMTVPINYLSLRFPFLDLSQDNFPYILILMLILISLLASVFGLLNAQVLTSVRERIQINGDSLKLHDELRERRKLALDQLVRGYGYTTTLIQISMFFVFMVILLLLATPVLGILILLSIPLLIIFLVFRQRKQVFLSKEAQDSRKSLGAMTPRQLLNPIKAQTNLFWYERLNAISSDFISNVVLAAMLILFFSSQSTDQKFNIATIILVFCVRFSLIYARESSLTLNRLLGQRTSLPQNLDIDIRDLGHQA